MKKFLCVLLAAVLAVLFGVDGSAASIYNSELSVRSEILYLQSIDDGTVIFDQNAETRCAPAAMLNIAAAMVVLRQVEDIDNTVYTVPDNILSILSGTNSSTMLFEGGEQFRVVDLLHCILMRSAADASVTLAIGVAGSVDQFVKMMNEYAASVGCDNTNFVNVTGLDDDGQYTTAADVARMMADASKDDRFCRISTSTTYDFPASGDYERRTLYTTNLMLLSGYPSYYYSNLTAAKTGSTSNAGRCVAAVASRDGYSYVAVVMKGPYVDTNGDGNAENHAFIDCKAMLNWTFRNIRIRVITDVNQTVGEVQVRYSSKADHVRLVPAEQITALVPSSVDTGSVVFRIVEEKTQDVVNAPVKKGDILGEAQVLYGEQVLAVVSLAAGEDVPFDLAGLVIGVAGDVFSSPVVVLLLLLILAAAVVYFVIGVRYDKKQGKFRLIHGGKKKNAGETDREGEEK